MLYVADTYNNKIKVIDPEADDHATLPRRRQAGQGRFDPPQFDEPAGISYAGGKLYVADTNNHLIRTIDLKSARRSNARHRGLEPPAVPPRKSRRERPTRLARSSRQKP